MGREFERQRVNGSITLEGSRRSSKRQAVDEAQEVMNRIAETGTLTGVPHNLSRKARRELGRNLQYVAGELRPQNGLNGKNGIHPSPDLGEVNGHQSVEKATNYATSKDVSESESDAQRSNPEDATSTKPKERLSIGPKITVDMFNPNPTRVDAGDLLQTFFGQETRMYAALKFPSPERKKKLRARKQKYLKSHPDVSAREYDERQQHLHEALLARLEQKVDHGRLHQAVAEQYDPSFDPKTFDLAQARNANSVINYALGHAAPRLRGVLGLKTEQGQVITKPERAFRFRFGDVHPRSQWEQRRQDLLKVLTGEFDTYIRISGIERHLENASEIIDTNLFSGLEGESTRRDFSIIYDKTTNEVRRIYDLAHYEKYRIPYDPETERVDDLPLEMRQFKESGLYALFDPRIKDIPAAVVKSLKKALGRKYETDPTKDHDPTIYPLEDAKDVLGMKFVVDTGANGVVDETEADQIAMRALFQVFDVLVDGGLSATIVDVEEDHDTNGTADQSKKVKYKRIQVKAMGDNNLPITFEIMVQTLKDYLNGERMIGNINPDTGRRDGPWHDGYNTERLLLRNDEVQTSQSVLNLLWPSSIYDTGKIPVDINEEAGRTKNRKAEVVIME
jgi:hypothetical protein